MRLLAAAAYHGLSLLALLVHLYLVVIVAVTLILTVPPGMAVPGLLLRLVVAAGWVVLLAFGLLLWLRRRWLVCVQRRARRLGAASRARAGLGRLVPQLGLLVVYSLFARQG